jgi:stage II sporulation protein GA (sporulation sigma-E factor processing peptidase)
MRYIYVDVLFFRILLDFIMDYLLLWATSEIAKCRVSRTRLISGALIGVAYSLLITLSQSGIIRGLSLLYQFPIMLAFSVLMVTATFAPINWRRLMNAMGIFYLIAFVSGGAALAAVYLTNGNWLLVDLVAIGVILMVTELGWGIIQKRLWRELFHVPIQITFGEASLTLDALVDTGNRLKDPLTGSPVVIVEYPALTGLFSEELKVIFNSMEKSDSLNIPDEFLTSPWSSRFRLIPYTSIGKERGMLIGFRPDEIRIIDDGHVIPVKNVIIGVHNRPLCPEGTYKALLHPDVFQTAMERA